MKKLRIALLSGGISTEREVSLKSGDAVLAALDPDKYDVTRYDPKFDILRLVTDAEKIDAALIILHGPYGEDGRIQGLLDILGIPYQGSGVLGSSVAMDKEAAKLLYQAHGIPTPAFACLGPGDTDKLDEAGNRLGFPLVVKPVAGGSSVGTALADNPDDLKKAAEAAFESDTRILLEEYIKGVEITCPVVGNQSLETLPLVEIVPAGDCRFFDYNAKYEDKRTREICPARLSDEIAQRARELGVLAHRALYCKGYSRTDMIIDGRGIFVLETNTIPGMTPQSLLPKAAKAAGLSFSALLDRLIALSLEDAENGQRQAVNR